MGHVVFDAVVATGFCAGRSSDSISEVAQAVADWRADLEPEWQPLVVGPIPSITNGYESFFFAADGSKSGWDTDETGVSLRAEFIALFDQGYYDVVEIGFGGDDAVAYTRKVVLNLRRRDSEEV